MTENTSLDKFVVNTDALKDFFVEMGIVDKDNLHRPFLDIFNRLGYEKYHTQTTLNNVLKKLEKEYDFKMPDDPAIRLFYQLGTIDFDVAYLYSPYLKEYITIHLVNLKKIEKLAKGMSKLMPLEVLAIYETDRFKIPKLRVYKAGTLQRESVAKGSEEYDENFFKKDSQKMFANFRNLLKTSPLLENGNGHFLE